MSLLSKETYEALERQLAMSPTVPKTELEAAYKLGIQYVLKMLRENYVNGRL